MSLAPSNKLAEQENGGTKTFQNVARCICKDNPEPPYKAILLSDAEEIVKEVNAIIREELIAAGFPNKNPKNHGNSGIMDLTFGSVESLRMNNGYFPEVPSKVIGFIHRWQFERSWYYYRAEGPGISPEFAVPFDKEWGRQVRVDGDCLCRGAEFWGEGYGISNYHIDTPDGLKAFVQLLSQVHKPRK